MLINTNGLAIFGPGSEWFWSMAQFVVVVVTLVGIYRQLRAQGGERAASDGGAEWSVPIGPHGVHETRIGIGPQIRADQRPHVCNGETAPQLLR